MRILWPSAFLLLGLIPLLLAAYFLLQRRRRRYAVRYSSLSLIRAALPAQSRLRRYLPMALFFLALASMIVGLARPVAVAQVPAGRATVLLVLDVSHSMRQRDISPSRLEAAKSAALSFIHRQKDTNQVGVVAFAGIAQLIHPPTTEMEELEDSIRVLTTGRGTAIGSGIETAMETLAEYNTSGAAVPVTGGGYAPDIIVLLTDGVYTTGPDPLLAAQQAVDSRVRIYTIGFGTNSGEPEGMFFGGRMHGIDEESLKAIASMTGGEYFTASSAAELQKVLDSLPTALITREETTEISVLFAALGALLIAGALILSQLWHPLP